MRKKILWVAQLIISVGVLCYISYIIPFTEVFQNISAANIWYILIALLLTQLNLYVSALKLKFLTHRQKMGITVGNIVKINYITKFYDLFLPQAVSGGVVRWYMLSNPDKKPAQALASMVFNKLSEMQILVLMGLSFWMIDKPPESTGITGMTLVILTMIMFSVYPIVLNQTISNFLFNCLNRLPFIPQIVIDKINKLLVSIETFKQFSKTELLIVFGFAFARYLIGLLSAYIFALSLGLNVGFFSIGWIRTILLIICLIPVSINGIGFREGSLIYMLGLYGVSPTAAVAYSFLFYIVNLFGAVIGGVCLIIKLFFTGRKTKTILQKIPGKV